MSGLKVLDMTTLALLATVWAVYILQHAPTRFDLNRTITLPLLLLLISAEYTAIFLIYAIWRYHALKGQKRVNPRSILERLYGTGEPRDEDHRDR